MQPLDEAFELEPWIVVANVAGDTVLQLWEVTELNEKALAIFSEEQLANDYAQATKLDDFQVLRFDQASMLKALIQCYSDGIKYLALNPSQSDVAKMFVVKDVLRAAKQQLSNEQSHDREDIR